MMDIPMMDSYLDSVAGYVRDEDKLVTYKWLSKELEVHVNLAKLILSRYWQRCKNDTLVATFMLIGNLKDGGMRVEVVRDSDVTKAKEKFEKIVSEHVYSLQKTLPDIELLAGSGKGDPRYSAIICKKSIVFSDEELLTMRWGRSIKTSIVSIEKKNEDSDVSKREPSVVKETALKLNETNDSVAKLDEKTNKKISLPTKHKNDKKGTVSKQPVQTTKAGFGHLFGNKAGNQRKSEAAVSASSTNGASESSRKSFSVSSSEGRIGKAAEDYKPGELLNKENDDNSCSAERSSVSSLPATESSSKGSGKNIEKATVSKKSKPQKNKKPLRGTKRERSNDSEEEIKKRKRIIVVSDSSEESAAASEDEDMFASPELEPPVRAESPGPPVVVEKHGGKRKIRKLVDKTFLGEDGYLVTRKESVYESCSDEEPEIIAEAKKRSEPEKVKEPIVNVKKKQTSLMSFFKRA